MDALEHDYSLLLRGSYPGPCISVYQPTHRQQPEKQQDPIRFRNLVRDVELSLRRKYRAREIHPLLTPLRELADNRELWDRTLDGLAVLAAPGFHRMYRLQREVPELAVVATSFHLKPLMRITQSADRYQILGLSRQVVRLFEGNRDVLDEVELSGQVPRSIADVFGGEVGPPERKDRVYGPVAPGATARQSFDVREDQRANDTERFFRAVDLAVLEHHSRPSGVPLLLAALPEHHHLFRAISRNPLLSAETINVHPDAIAVDALRKRAWQLLEPRYLDRLRKLIDDFHDAKSKGLGTDNLIEGAQAATDGRIATLLIEAERRIPGAYQRDTGAIALLDDTEHPEVDDLLDDVGEQALKNGAAVVVVPARRMPTDTGIAATYRF